MSGLLMVGSILIFPNFGYAVIAVRHWENNRILSILALIALIFTDLWYLASVLYVLGVF